MRYLPALVVVGLLVYCLIDCLQTPAATVRSLPKPAWLAVIVLLPPLGSIGWLLAGRPGGSPRAQGPRRPRGPQGPDDDPDFLRGLGGGPTR